MRDDFSRRTTKVLADRAGNRCSNPGCRQPTSGPRTDPDRAVNIGVAAHITAASEGGPRYDPALTPEARRHPDNGLWLCQNCAKLVDNDPTGYPVDLLRAWKRQAEDAARRDVAQPGSGRMESEGSSRVQIGGGIQAGEIHAQNVVSGVQVIGVPGRPARDDLRRQIAELEAQRAQAATGREREGESATQNGRAPAAATEASREGEEPDGSQEDSIP